MAMNEYIEVESDHHMTAFLAGLTPGRVLRDREPITKIERKRLRFMHERLRLEAAVAMARETFFTDAQMAVALRSHDTRGAA